MNGKLLVSHEYSGRVRDAFIARGIDAMSCDLRPTESPGPHYQGDIRDLLRDPSEWAGLISFPDCTYVCVSGLHWNKRRPERQKKTDEALDHVRWLMSLPIDLFAMENPVGCISTEIRKPDQVIQPYQFGDNASKKTCLWLKGFPALVPTEYVAGDYACPCGHRFRADLGAFGCPNCEGTSGAARMVWANQTGSGQNKLGPSPDRAKLRALTYRGIAEAMASQWSYLFKAETNDDEE